MPARAEMSQKLCGTMTAGTESANNSCTVVVVATETASQTVMSVNQDVEMFKVELNFTPAFFSFISKERTSVDLKEFSQSASFFQSLKFQLSCVLLCSSLAGCPLSIKTRNYEEN